MNSFHVHTAVMCVATNVMFNLLLVNRHNKDVTHHIFSMLCLHILCCNQSTGYM